MYLFNPDNDLALANFSAYYTAPQSVRKMTEDLAALPFWYAPNGSKVVVEGDEDKAFLKSMQSLFDIETTPIVYSEIGDFLNEKIKPWGWSPALREKLLKAKVSEKNLPTIEELKQLQNYSGRQNAVQMLDALKPENSFFCGESHYLTTIEEVCRFLVLQTGNSVLKMPNSGSGKGLVWILGNITDKQTDWVQRVLKIQGGIIAEPVLTKKEDFAMEFQLKNGKASFIGYSLFQSAAFGAYLGNVLMSDEAIENRLSSYIPIDVLHQLRASLQEKLPMYFPNYNGFLGVDMMICQTENGFRIQPCVEINMRMNMGLVAHTFYNQFVENGGRGRYVVDFFKKSGDALAFHQRKQNEATLSVQHNKIEEGYLSLTPVNQQSLFMVWVEISRKNR